MAHHPNVQRDITQEATPGIPTGPMTPPPSFQPLQVPPPFMRRDPVPIGGPGSQYHITNQGRSIPSFTQFRGTPLYPPLVNLPLQRAPFQHQAFQHAPHPEFQHAPHQEFQHAPHQEFQYAPVQHPPFQYAPLQRQPFQHAQFQRPDVGAARLPWGYTYPAPLLATAPHLATVPHLATAPHPASVPHQETTHPSGQAPPVKKAVAKGEKSPAAAPAEANCCGRCYPNPMISNGGKLLLTLTVS